MMKINKFKIKFGWVQPSQKQQHVGQEISQFVPFSAVQVIFFIFFVCTKEEKLLINSKTQECMFGLQHQNLCVLPREAQIYEGIELELTFFPWIFDIEYLQWIFIVNIHLIIHISNKYLQFTF